MKLLIALLLLLVSSAEAWASQGTSVCFSKAGTRFDRLTAKECAAQGWEMRDVPADEPAQAAEDADVGGASRTYLEPRAIFAGHHS